MPATGTLQWQHSPEWRQLRGVWLDQTTGTTRYCGQRPNNENPVLAWMYERASKLEIGDNEDPGNSGLCRCGVLAVRANGC